MNTSPPPGWYADPERAGGYRYFDGASWTEHRTAPQATIAAGPSWKGAQYSRPQSGPGSLADPTKRLGARLIDGLLLSPVTLGLAALAIVLIAPHAGPMFPADPESTACAVPGSTQNISSQSPEPVPGFVWIELGLFGAAFLAGLIYLAYETIATAMFGRTLGKKWLGIRPIRTDGQPLSFWRALARIATYWFGSCIQYVGILVPLWCLWDADSQCLHDKVVGTLVIND